MDSRKIVVAKATLETGASGNGHHPDVEGQSKYSKCINMYIYTYMCIYNYIYIYMCSVHVQVAVGVTTWSMSNLRAVRPTLSTTRFCIYGRVY